MTKVKHSTDGGAALSQNPFDKLAALSSQLPTGSVSSGSGSKASVGSSVPSSPAVTPPSKNRGRVDILRSTAGRGGKTVTIVQGFVGIGLPEKEDLARRMQKRCGTGGTVKEGRIEVQGDQREAVAEILTAAGFRPVFAGG